MRTSVSSDASAPSSASARSFVWRMNAFISGSPNSAPLAPANPPPNPLTPPTPPLPLQDGDADLAEQPGDLLRTVRVVVVVPEDGDHSDRQTHQLARERLGLLRLAGLGEVGGDHQQG